MKPIIIEAHTEDEAIDIAEELLNVFALVDDDAMLWFLQDEFIVDNTDEPFVIDESV